MRSFGRIGLAVVAALVLLGAPVRGEDKEALQRRINRAKERGVAYLKGLLAKNENGLTYPANFQGTLSFTVGPTALAGLTLLECGVPADDKAVQRVAQIVRKEGIGLTKTYELSLAIMFLERLGDEGDVPLMESLAIRLMAGQNAAGGWSYDCPPISEAEVKRLKEHYRGRSELVSKRKLPEKSEAPKKRTVDDLPQEIKDQLAQIAQQGNGRLNLTTGDNSNTQFATLALWIARRKGLPTHRALVRVEARFRECQNQTTGKWGYTANPEDGAALNFRTPQEAAESFKKESMICAGLLGLAVAHGTGKKESAPPLEDPAIRRALAMLGREIDRPGEKRQPDLYFLWSLERVGVLYDLRQIDGKDWYAWGRKVLLARQQVNGSWTGGGYHGANPVIDTCFALLFLNQANLAGDLTAKLRLLSEKK